MAGLSGLLVPGNIDLHSRPVVRNKDGSISTVRSMSVNIDGNEVLIPTVAADGSRVLSDADAVDQYRRTGQHLGIFRSPQAATAYAQQLHKDQEREYGDKRVSGLSPYDMQQLLAEMGQGQGQGQGGPMGAGRPAWADRQPAGLVDPIGSRGALGLPGGFGGAPGGPAP
jgi:hypothetical protein